MTEETTRVLLVVISSLGLCLIFILALVLANHTDQNRAVSHELQRANELRERATMETKKKDDIERLARAIHTANPRYKPFMKFDDLEEGDPSYYKDLMKQAEQVRSMAGTSLSI